LPKQTFGSIEILLNSSPRDTELAIPVTLHR
jgi:hypothetical protein